MATDLITCDACDLGPAPREDMRVTADGTFHADGCPADRPLLVFWSRGR